MKTMNLGGRAATFWIPDRVGNDKRLYPSCHSRENGNPVRTLKFLYLKLFLAGLLSFSPTIVLAEDAGLPPAGGDSHFEAAASSLNLTVEQKEKIRELRQSQKEQMKALFQELQMTRQQLKDELNNINATRESLAALAAETKAITAKMIDQRIDGVMAVKEVLTPEQFNQLHQASEQMRQARGQLRQTREQMRQAGEQLQDVRKQMAGEEKGCRSFWSGKRRLNKEEKKLGKNQEK